MHMHLTKQRLRKLGSLLCLNGVADCKQYRPSLGCSVKALLLNSSWKNSQVCSKDNAKDKIHSSELQLGFLTTQLFRLILYRPKDRSSYPALTSLLYFPYTYRHKQIPSLDELESPSQVINMSAADLFFLLKLCN